MKIPANWIWSLHSVSVKNLLTKGRSRQTKASKEALRGSAVAISDVGTDKRIQYQKAFLAEGIASMLLADHKKRFEIIIQKLRDNGHRITPQRLAIVKILAKSEDHPSVENIHDQIKKAFRP
jgi:hypothetical protein